MKTKIFKELDFTGQIIYIGLEVHLNSWTVTILTATLEHKTFRQPPNAKQLVKYLNYHFPKAQFACVYEAGFCGFWICEELISRGIDCIVVNPADVPTTDKEKKSKTDPRDSRKLAKALRSGLLTPNHIPSRAEQESRTLIRIRKKIRGNLTRCKNRIKSMLHFYGIQIPEPFQGTHHWSAKFIDWLQTIKQDQQAGDQALELLIEELLFLKKHLNKATRHVRDLMQTKAFKNNSAILVSIPGVGPLTTMSFLTEVGDVRRFKTVDQLCSFIGFIPNTYNSGDTERVGRMTKRCNSSLRSDFVEAAWQAVRKDPALALSYENLKKRMKGQQAIIRIARKLVNRARYLLITQTYYQTGVTK